MIYSKRFFSSFEEGIDKQWLITNGIGGYASSTLIGCNTRKYHGLLVMPKKPPFERTYYVSKINEAVIVNGKKYDISSNECIDYISKGHNYQTSFEKEYYPVYEYSVGNSIIKKSICMVYGKPITIVKYDIRTLNKDITMEFSPLINYREFHSTNTDIEKITFSQIKLDDENLKIIYDTENNLYINSNIKDYTKLNKTFFYNMHYRVEKSRGLDNIENHLIPGIYSINIENNSEKSVYFCFSTEVIENIDIEKTFNDEIERQKNLIQSAEIFNDYANKLTIAADQFIIKKSNDNYGILAGYPWFDEWGRDKFIAFEGLLLVTKRFDIAKKILKDSIIDVKNGIMANTYNHLTGERLYNSVDAGLWFFEAINKYIKYTNDIDFVKNELYETMKNIILSYNDGTDFSIYVDKQDGLLACGDENIQLTWMDAKVGEKVITPRNGKCVEINALWYNALMIISTLNDIDSNIYMRLASKCKASFNDKFWNVNKYCLYDVIEPYSTEIRPNQILALSLSHPIITDKSKAKDILDTVQEHLYTPYGLRTLSPYSKLYKGKYYGDVLQRDSSYHQGTVWPWLLSEYIISFCRINKYSIKDRQKWIKYIEVLRENIVDDCIDSISEIFDGDKPHNPNGAFAQAWSVANILKLYSEVE